MYAYVSKPNQMSGTYLSKPPSIIKEVCCFLKNKKRKEKKKVNNARKKILKQQYFGVVVTHNKAAEKNLGKLKRPAIPGFPTKERLVRQYY